MRNVSHQNCRENQNTHIVLNDFFFENRAVYEIMWKYIVERGRPEMTIRRMRSGCWTPKATNTHTQTVQYSLPFHDNIGCTNAPRCYVILTLAILFSISFMVNILVHIM